MEATTARDQSVSACKGGLAHLDRPICQVVHHGRQQRGPVGGTQHLGALVAGDSGHGIGGAEIDADGELLLLRMGIGRGAGLMDLEKIHSAASSRLRRLARTSSPSLRQ